MHSPTSKRKENFECVLCKKTFERYVFTKDGIDLKAIDYCPECERKKRELANEESLKRQLERAIEAVSEKWCLECNITQAEKTFEEFDKKLQPKAYDTVINYDYKKYDENSLVMLSPNVYGVGKTHLVCALAMRIINTEPPAEIRIDSYNRKYVHKSTRLPVIMFQENQLMRRIRSTFNQNSEETEEQVYNKLSTVGLLIIDDVGKLRPRDPSFLQGVWFSIIDERYSNHSPVILTTNLTPDELESHIGGAAADRLREMCGKKGFIIMGGTSYRRR